MRAGDILTAAVALAAIVFGGCQQEKRPTMWELKCAACHDGRTVLNGKVVASREQLALEYKTLDAFSGACTNTPACMNILKHDKGLFMEVGKEIGLGAR